MYRPAIIIAFLALTACTSKLVLSLPAGSPVSIVSGQNARQLQPSDADYRQLQKWLAQNQNGWSQVYATNPNGGIFVSGGHLRLQFVGPAVFAVTKKGMFSKSVKESQYAFLKIAPST